MSMEKEKAQAGTQPEEENKLTLTLQELEALTEAEWDRLGDMAESGKLYDTVMKRYEKQARTLKNKQKRTLFLVVLAYMQGFSAGSYVANEVIDQREKARDKEK